MDLLRRSLLLLPWALRAQVSIQPRPLPPKKDDPTDAPSLRVDTSLVLIPVTVNDPLGRPVTGLDKDNFKLQDDGVDQVITQFAMEDEPVAIGLVFDTSGSMGSKLRMSRFAASEVFRMGQPEDEYFLVEFDSNPRLAVPLTSDYGAIEEKLTFSKSKGSTALLDAIYLGLHEMRKSKKHKKALLIISDGGDNNSRYTETEVLNVVKEADVLIYSIGVFGGGSTPEERSGPYLLRKVSEQTGARLYEASIADLPDTARHIGLELRNRYVLGYRPTNIQRDGRFHRVMVRIIAPRGLPKLTASWRRGYYAPD